MTNNHNVTTKSSDTIIGRRIDEVTKETLKYIDDRRKGRIVALKTKWNKLNKYCFIEPNMIYTVAGTSGTGKSAFVNALSNDLIDLNPTQKIVVLNFSFEMVSFRNVGRLLSNKLKMTTNQLYSQEETISDTTYQQIQEEAFKLNNKEIYWVDTPTTVENIEKTIRYYLNSIAKDKWLIVTLDHTLLVNGDSERGTIVDLQKMFIRIKKLGKISIFQISQMNRNIETSERINNPITHFPMRSDLSASDAIFQASDYVMVLHRPELLNIQYYGVNRLPTANKVYLHLLKVREGEPCILTFENELCYGDLSEKETDAKQKVVFNK